MPKYNQNRMTLNTVGFTPTVSDSLVYKPVETDYGILAKSMALQDERKKEAIQQQTAIDTALGKIETDLNPAEFEWFSKEKQRIKDNINDAVQVGDYTSAINTAISEVGRISNNTEWIGRIKNSAEYNQEMQRLDKMVETGYLTANEAKYYKRHNLYENKIVRDDSGRAIGTDQWKLSETPVKHLDINALFDDTFRSIHPSRITHDNASNVLGRDGKPIYQDSRLASEVSGYTTKSASSVQKVKPNEIIAQARERLYNTPNWEQALKQMWGGDFEQYNEDLERLKLLDENSQEYKALEASIDLRTPLFYDGKTPKKEDQNTFMNYFNRKIFMSPQAAAYGYTIEDYNNSLIYSGSSDINEVNKALEEERQQLSQYAPFISRNGYTPWLVSPYIVPTK